MTIEPVMHNAHMIVGIELILSVGWNNLQSVRSLYASCILEYQVAAEFSFIVVFINN